MNRYSIYNAFLYIIIIIIVAIIYQYNVSNNMETPEKSFVVSLGCVFVVLTVGLLLTSSSIKFKDKIFWAKKEVGERYKILEYKQNKNNNELFISRDFMGKLNKMSHIHILRVYEEYIKINIHGYVVKIGTWTSMDRCSSYGHRLFVELEQNNNFNTQIIIKDADNWDEIINNIAIIPKYKNINFIYCKDNGYATSIITESIQKIISNLATQLKDFSMAFYETKILIVLHDTSWSTFFSRTFNRKKNAENIVKSAETIINTLEQIAREIDKNNK